MDIPAGTVPSASEALEQTLAARSEECRQGWYEALGRVITAAAARGSRSVDISIHLFDLPRPTDDDLWAISRQLQDRGYTTTVGPTAGDPLRCLLIRW